MRTENEILGLIKDYANQHDKIRVVLMNGSRVNPTIKKDKYQDYDIVFLVDNLDYFKVENRVVPFFGDISLLEKPEDKIFPEPLDDGRYTYLMQFKDDIRIDLQIIPLKKKEIALDDSLTKVILDKDNIVPELNEPNLSSYYVKEPSKKYFDDCCNSFIWGLGSHIPKTYYREELVLLKILIGKVLRVPLLKMFEWYANMINDERVDVGKGYKKLNQWIPDKLWATYKKTYADDDFNNIHQSIVEFYRLFKLLGTEVAEHYNFEFPSDELEIAFNNIKNR